MNMGSFVGDDCAGWATLSCVSLACIDSVSYSDIDEALTYHIASSDTADPLDLFMAMAVQCSH